MPAQIISGSDRLPVIKELFQEYANSLNIDLGYQNYAQELENLPGCYAPPDGRLYLALVDKMPAGCAALRRFDQDHAELKRLYVRPAFRGHQIGKQLAEVAIGDAGEIGYHSLLLDTLPSMQGALLLYRELGFQITTPYYDTPIADTLFFELPLTGREIH